jgi:hypothetical protein
MEKIMMVTELTSLFADFLLEKTESADEDDCDTTGAIWPTDSLAPGEERKVAMSR